MSERGLHQDLVGEFSIPAIPCGVCRFAARPVEDEFCSVCVPPSMSFFERDDAEIRRRIETKLYLLNKTFAGQPPDGGAAKKPRRLACEAAGGAQLRE